MRMIAVAALTSVTMALLTTTAGASPPAPDLVERPDKLAEVVDEVIQPRVGSQTPGAVVAVVHGDDVVHAQGYGVADTTTGEPVSAQQTAFAVGSVGKLVTYTAVMQGVEDGVLDLDADVDTYLHDTAVSFAEDAYGPITLRHLATHTAGFAGELNPGMVTDPAEAPSLAQAVVEARPERVRAPGEAVAYSNYGAMLAGHIVAEAYDTSFETYVEERIFEPLGMTDATFLRPAGRDRAARLATPHIGGEGVFEPTDRTHIAWSPAGSMRASATDMAAFMSAHLGDGAHGHARILEPGTVREMHEVHHERHPDSTGLRFGFWEHRDPDAGLLAHDGATLHQTSHLLLAPEHDAGIFVAYNVRNDESPPGEVIDELAEDLGLLDVPSPPEPAPADAARERAAMVAGQYRSTMTQGRGLVRLAGLLSTLDIEPDQAGGIHLSMPGSQKRFVEAKPYVYREVDGRDTLAAEVTDDRVEALHLSSMSMTSFLPVGLASRTDVVGGVLATALAVFLLSLLGWASVGISRRVRARPAATSTGAAERVGRGAAIALAVTAWGWLGLGFLGIALEGALPALVLQPWPLRIALGLPYLVVAFAVLTLGAAGASWRSRRGPVWRRGHVTLLGVLGLTLVWPFTVLGLW